MHQPTAISYTVSRSLRELFPGSEMVTGRMDSFNLEAYAAEELCGAVERPNPIPERLTYLAGPENERVTRPNRMLFDVTWEEHHLLVPIMHYPDHQGIYHYWILAGTVETVDAFHTAVCAWNSWAPEEYILVFDVNGRNRDDALLAAIAGATLDNLVLQGTMKDEILADIQDFFASIITAGWQRRTRVQTIFRYKVAVPRNATLLRQKIVRGRGHEPVIVNAPPVVNAWNVWP